MRRVEDPSEQLRWLVDQAGDEEVAGYNLKLWPAASWVLHRMYENPALSGLGTHDEWHKRRLDAGDIAPLIIGEVNLEGVGAVTGTSLGFVVRPGQDWQRLTWDDYIRRTASAGAACGYPPCFRWFPPGSWPVAIEPPPEGSLDEESLAALLELLAGASPDGHEALCYAYYAPLAANDYDTPHLWLGPLRAVPDLIDERGGPYPSSPSNLWSVDRTWFVWTDWDLQGTKVSGSAALIDALESDTALETAAGRPTTES